jgi:hypothetical protein
LPGIPFEHEVHTAYEPDGSSFVPGRGTVTVQAAEASMQRAQRGGGS